jgi:CRP-like cAMP-binding protein
VVTQQCPEAPPVDVLHLGPGDVFGEAGLFGAGTPRTATAKAVGAPCY